MCTLALALGVVTLVLRVLHAASAAVTSRRGGLDPSYDPCNLARNGLRFLRVG